MSTLQTPAWTSTSPAWRVQANRISLSGSSDQRLVGREAPASFRWECSLKLTAGRSAGVLFGASKDGKEGYVARLDSRLGMLILGRLGSWPKEDRVATFPWEPIDGSQVNLRVEVGSGTARVFCKERGAFPILEARNIKLPGTHIGLYGIDAEANFQPRTPTAFEAPQIVSHVPIVGPWVHVFDQSVGEEKPWYVNDHCIFHGPDGWHLYGITHEKPADPMHEREFAHATASTLLQQPWKKEPFALTFDPEVGENHLWAPHVIQKGKTYYMFYCAGSRESNYHYRIHLATSKDLTHWERYRGNPVFEDFYDARDPMVLLIDGVYYLYYTANLDQERNHHVVNVRTSRDLLRWSPARVAFIHPEKGTFGGPTESPFVVHYGDHFYLFCGPDGDYRATKVYRSSNPYHWNYEDQIYSFPSHAAEVVQDLDGVYYATNSGWDLDGIYLGRMDWKPSK